MEKTGWHRGAGGARGPAGTRGSRRAGAQLCSCAPAWCAGRSAGL